MRRLAGESQGLQNTPAIARTQARRAIESATERLGATGRLSVQGERATLTLQSAKGDAVWAWLSEARSAARASQGNEATLNNLLNIIGRRDGARSIISIG